MRTKTVLAALTAIAALGAGAFYLRRPLPPPGEPLADFQLIDTEGHGHFLYRQNDAEAVGFFSVDEDCASMGAEVARFEKLKTEFPRVRFFALNASPTQTRGGSREMAKKTDLRVPVLNGEGQLAARAMKLDRAGQLAILETKTFRQIYLGPPEERRVRRALNGRPDLSGNRENPSCPIVYLKDREELTYTKHIAPILKQKCFICHSQQGLVKPYFDGYDAVASWSAMIRQVVLTRRMPPWQADSDPREFDPDFSLPSELRRRLVSWIEQGMKRGDGPDPMSNYLPEIRWKPLPGASLSVAMRSSETIAADEGNTFRYFQIAGPMKRDMWIELAEAFSRNPQVVHHISLLVTPEPLKVYKNAFTEWSRDPSYEAAKDGKISDACFMSAVMKRRMKRLQGLEELTQISLQTGYGRATDRYTRTGTAWHLPKGYYLILEMHYKGTGKTEEDQTRVFLYETQAKNPKRIHSLDSIANQFEVPAFTETFRVDLPVVELDRDIYVLSCLPHMHLRGREFRAWAELPDGRTERILSLYSYNYDFHQGRYTFARPKLLPKGTRIFAYALLDNSARNPANSEPELPVGFGMNLERDEMPRFKCDYIYAGKK